MTEPNYTRCPTVFGVYRIDTIQKSRHPDGSVEVVPCDATLELLAREFDNIGVYLPITKEHEQSILDRFTQLDIEIGQNESDKIHPTEEYDEQVCRAVDEFNLDDNEYIDYDELSRRMEMIFKEIEAGTFEPYVKVKWRRTRN